MSEKKHPFSHFEIEVESLNRHFIARGVINEVRVGRGRRQIVLEAWMRDAYNSMEFRNRGVESFEAALPLLFDQIDHRGFIPRRYRVLSDNRWSEWKEIEGYPKDEILKELSSR